MHANLDEFVIVGELQAAVVDGAVSRDEELDRFGFHIGVELEVVRREMVHQDLERHRRPIERNFFGHGAKNRPGRSKREAFCVS